MYEVLTWAIKSKHTN